MSEFQYYEFQSAGGPLTQSQRAMVSSLSSRVRLSSNRAIFTYNYGDFRGNPLDLLHKCFDGLFYTTNWGTTGLHFKFPKESVSIEALQIFCLADALSVEERSDSVILSLTLQEDTNDDSDEVESFLEDLMPLREQILEGDYRCLYLHWLNGAALEEDDDTLEPPVPSGLNEPDDALKALAKIFRYDDDLAAVAATMSGKRPTSEAVELQRWIPQLSEEEKHTYLQSLLRGNQQAVAKLRGRLRAIALENNPVAAQSDASGQKRRSVTQLCAEAAARRGLREAEERLQREAARVRSLEILAGQEREKWAEAALLVGEKKVPSYERAVRILKQLKELAAHRGTQPAFQWQVKGLYEQYRSLSAFKRMFTEAGILE